MFAERAAVRMMADLPFIARPGDVEPPPPPDLSKVPEAGIREVRGRLKQLMWDQLGIVRSRRELEAGAEALRSLRRDWTELQRASSSPGTAARWAEAAETLNMLDIADLVVRCALWRCESRGLHYVSDFPYRNNERYLRDTLVWRGD